MLSDFKLVRASVLGQFLRQSEWWWLFIVYTLALGVRASSFNIFDPAVSLSDLDEILLLVQDWIYVFHLASQDGLAFSRRHFLPLAPCDSMSEICLVTMDFWNVSMGWFPLICYHRADLLQGCLVLLELACDYVFTAKVSLIVPESCVHMARSGWGESDRISGDRADFCVTDRVIVCELEFLFHFWYL